MPGRQRVFRGSVGFFLVLLLGLALLPWRGAGAGNQLRLRLAVNERADVSDAGGWIPVDVVATLVGPAGERAAVPITFGVTRTDGVPDAAADGSTVLRTDSAGRASLRVHFSGRAEALVAASDGVHSMQALVRFRHKGQAPSPSARLVARGAVRSNDSSPLSLAGPLPDGSVGIAYQGAPATVGGVAPYYYWIDSGALPNGLQLDSNSGTIAGTPATSGSYSLSITVDDATNTMASVQLTLAIHANPPTITTASLPDGTVGQSYSANLSANGVGTQFYWFIDGLPPGLSLDAGSGVLSGVPTMPGDYVLGIQVIDEYEQGASASLTVHIVGNPPQILTNSLPDGTVGQSYTATLTAIGVSNQFYWFADALPPGLSLDSVTGILSGVPTAAGDFSVSVQVMDEYWQSNSATLPLHIGGNPPAILTDFLPNGTVGAAYSVTLSAVGGSPPYNWYSMSLPSGLVLDYGTGVISGTPTAAGTYPVEIYVTDQFAQFDETELWLVIVPNSPVVTTTSLPDGTVGTSYSAALNAVGGTPPYSWYVEGLPAGLAADAGSGAISGTPTQPGVFTVSVNVSDQYGQWGSAQLDLTIADSPPTITTTALPDGTVGQPYSVALTATGGSTPYYWWASGLPAGLDVDEGGNLGGIPGQPGVYSLTVGVADEYGASSQAQLSLTIHGSSVTITTSSLPNGMVGQPYTASLTASGGIAPYYWWFSGLPGGLGSGEDGSISGVPVQAGTYMVTVNVSDIYGDTATAVLPLVITGNPPVITTTGSLPDGTVGQQYSASLAATGGVPPYSWFVVGLPSGLACDTLGGITGTPSQAGTFTLSVTVMDSLGQSGTAQLSLTIAPNQPVITTTSLPNGVVDQQYLAVVNAAGGIAPYTWSFSGLPDGLAGDESGTISGSPVAAGIYDVEVMLFDSLGQPANALLTLTVGIDGLDLAPRPLPDGAVGQTYDQTVRASGGDGNYTWSLASGSLPPGISLTTPSTPGARGAHPHTGSTDMSLFAGVPTAPGYYQFAVNIGSGGTTSTFNMWIRVNGTGGDGWTTTTGPLSVDVVNPNQPPQMVVYDSKYQTLTNQWFEMDIVASGGYPGGTWKWTQTNVPAWLNFQQNGYSPVLSGTAPPTPGSYTLSLSAENDYDDPYALVHYVWTGNLTVTINVVSSYGPSITTPTPAPNGGTAVLPSVQQGVAYSQPLAATGGTPAYSWSWQAQTGLPPGLNAPHSVAQPGGGTSWVIDGTPSAAGTYQFLIIVTDQAGQTDQESYSLTVTNSQKTYYPGDGIQCDGIHATPAVSSNYDLVAETGSKVHFSASASDMDYYILNGIKYNDPDVPVYAWQASGGSFTSTGATSMSSSTGDWTAPTVPGDYIVKLTVDDQEDRNLNGAAGTRHDNPITPDRAGFTVTVHVQGCRWEIGTPIQCAGITSPAVNAGTRMASTAVAAGAQVKLACATATDNDLKHHPNGTTDTVSDIVYYKWSCPAGSFASGIDDVATVNWVAPVTDSGGTYTLSVTINDGGKLPPGDTGSRDDPALTPDPQQHPELMITITVLPRQQIDHLEYMLPDAGGGMSPVPTPLVLSAGTRVIFQAVPKYPGVAWPTGKPVWSGSNGIAGSGTSFITTTFNVLSQSPTDYQTVTAECINTVSAQILVCKLSSVTLDTDHVLSGGYANEYHQATVSAAVTPAVAGLKVNFGLSNDTYAAQPSSLSANSAVTDDTGQAQVVLTSSNTVQPNASVYVNAWTSVGSSRSDASSAQCSILLPDNDFPDADTDGSGAQSANVRRGGGLRGGTHVSSGMGRSSPVTRGHTRRSKTDSHPRRRIKR